MDEKFRESIIEALIMASPEPLPGKKIAEQLEEMTASKIAKVVTQLNERYVESGSSFRIRELAGGYQFYILSEFTSFVQDMFARRRKLRLTRAALETLAIIAYKQPATKTEIEQIRGVASDGVIHNLLEKNMITVKGRANTVGKPLQYGTTDEFLKFFGLNKLDDLPKMSEIEELVASAEDDSQSDFNFESFEQDGVSSSDEAPLLDEEAQEEAPLFSIDNGEDEAPVVNVSDIPVEENVTDENSETSPQATDDLAEDDEKQSAESIIVDLDNK